MEFPEVIKTQFAALDENVINYVSCLNLLVTYPAAITTTLIWNAE